MADEDARRESVPVVPRPVVRERERTEEQRRVGHSPGDHDVGTLRERVGDRTCAEIRGREQRRRRQRVERPCRVSRWANGSPAAWRSSSRGRRSSPSTVAIVMPVIPSDRAVSIAARAAAAGLMPPALVTTLVRPSATYGSARARYAGQIARVAARLVALAILLQDRERQLGQRLEAQEVDTFREQRVGRRRRVAVEALTAGDVT